MKLVKNNPYRIVGLLVGASAKEQERQKRRLLQFIEAEQEPEEDFSFPIIGKVDRTVETVNEAVSKLNLDSDRMNSALFWFYKGNDITDEPAFDLLKNSDQKGATEIWLKMIANNEVTKRNSSAFQNLSTLLLCHSFNGQQINDELLEKSIALKLKFLESEFVQDIKAISTDETYKISKNDIQLLFLNQILGEIDKNGNLDSKKFFNMINKQQFIAKEEFLKLFIQKPIETIEKRIAEAKVIRKSNKANAANAGKMLFQQAHPDLLQLNSFIGISGLKVSTISDKLSGELLQCGIDYFSYHRDSNTDPSKDVMDLFRKAKSLAIGNIARERCKENMIGLQEWIDSKPIINDLEKLKELIEEYKTRIKNEPNAKLLLVSAIPYLNNIKAILGSTDDLYLGLSTKIASDALNLCLTPYVGLKKQFDIEKDDLSKLTVILLLKGKISPIYEVFQLIDKMDLKSVFRKDFEIYKTFIHNEKTQLDQIDSGRITRGSGCYIATMVYGDYTHPQVMFLRLFRDNVLDKSILGKLFIKTYYHYAPKLVEKLRGKKTVNSIIRKSLDQFIKLIKL